MGRKLTVMLPQEKDSKTGLASDGPLCSWPPRLQGRKLHLYRTKMSRACLHKAIIISFTPTQISRKRLVECLTNKTNYNQQISW